MSLTILNIARNVIAEGISLALVSHACSMNRQYRFRIVAAFLTCGQGDSKNDFKKSRVDGKRLMGLYTKQLLPGPDVFQFARKSDQAV